MASNLLSDEAAMILQWLMSTGICETIDLVGIVSNTINIICFVKQGFKDPVNISLLGLAVSDIGCLSTLIWTNICFTPAFMTADLPFDSIEFQYLTTAMLHMVFTRITSWITAFITFERCLCVTMPLKVKYIITSERVAVIIVAIFIILFISVTPVYVANRLDLKFFPHKNKTLIGLVFNEGYESFAQFAYMLNNVTLSIGSFVVTIVCTVILVIYLRKNTKWRKKSANLAQTDNMSTRNQSISKMVVMISILFIVSFIPSSLVYIGISLEPELFIDGKYRNLCVVLGTVCTILESTNSSANILIYYHMSNKYRTSCRQLFLRQISRNENQTRSVDVRQIDNSRTHHESHDLKLID